MKVSAEYAAEHFDDLASAVDDGEVVEIARLHKPALQLVRSSTSDASVRAGKRILGAGTAVTALPDEDELERIDREWKREIEHKVIG